MICPERSDVAGAEDRDDGPTPDWLKLADGRPWRLARGTDFAEEIPTFVESARRAARLMGRAVVVVGDRLDPEGHVWLQFADGEIDTGGPCPCGSVRLIRLAATFVKCEACGRVLVEQKRKARARNPVPATASEAEHAAEADVRVDDFRSVRLARVELTAGREVLAGFGLDEHDRHALLLVTVPLVHGAPVPDETSRIGIVHAVTFALADVFASIERMDDTWDIVLE